MGNSTGQKTYCPKHQPPRVPQQFFLGVSLRVGLSRSIFPGAGRSTVSKHQTCRRAQKGYSRISLTRFASCIAPTSPAITSAQLVSSACAPEIGRSTNIKLTAQKTSLRLLLDLLNKKRLPRLRAAFLFMFIRLLILYQLEHFIADR